VVDADFPRRGGKIALTTEEKQRHPRAQKEVVPRSRERPLAVLATASGPVADKLRRWE